MIEILDSSLPIDLDGYEVSAEDSFVHALTTVRGSIIHNRGYGTDFHKLKHRPFNQLWLIDFRRYAKDACKYDDRLEFKGMDIDDSHIDKGKITFSLYVGVHTIEGAINV
jgi:phage baseplate assembly protein W